MSKDNAKKSAKSSKPLAGLSTTTDAGKRAKVRLAHPDNPSLWVRAYVDVIQEHGIPHTEDGRAWVPSQAPRGGLSPEERAARAKAKEERKAKLAAMTPEQKAEFLKAERDAKRVAKAKKEAAAREKLIAQIEAAVKAGKDPREVLKD